MNKDEQEFIKKLQKWQVDSPPAYLADNIVHYATKQAQYQPWAVRVAKSLETAFTQWSYGLSYKLASLAIFAALGFSGGIFTVSDEQDDILSQATSIALGDEEWSGL